MTSHGAPEYTRAQPPEWPMLYAEIEQIMPPGRPYNSRGYDDVRRATENVDSLDNLSLETTYYYGTGLTMQGLERKLGQPAIQEAVVQGTAHNIANTHYINCAKAQVSL